MLRRTLLAAVLALGLPGPAGAATVTDGAGRSVDVPEEAGRVVVAGPPASVYAYVLKPDALAGWVRAFTPSDA